MNETLLFPPVKGGIKIPSAYNLLHFNDNILDETGKTTSSSSSSFIDGPFEETKGFKGSVVISRIADFTDWTFDFWLYFVDGSEVYFYHNGQSSTIGQSYWYNKSTVYRHNDKFYWRNAGTHNVPLNEWHHFALVRKSNVIKFYVDGKQKNSASTSAAFWSPYSLNTGNNYISEYRFSTYAQWENEFVPFTEKYMIN